MDATVEELWCGLLVSELERSATSAGHVNKHEPFASP